MAEEKSVVALFVDVRGFTKWSDDVEVFANLDTFITGFIDILSDRFKEYTLKPLGDGAMLVREIDPDISPSQTQTLLGQVLRAIRSSDLAFSRHCESFSRRIGHHADLLLGWGVVRGKVLKLENDWAGSNINKASRLCGEARPFGIVVDRDDFSTLPRSETSFVPEVRRLSGISEDTPVWVTREIASQFVPRERLKEEPEVHVAGTCIQVVDGRVELMVAKRSSTRRLYPNLLEGCGGQLRRSESFSNGVKRHFSLELGIDVEVLVELHKFYEIVLPDTPLIPGIRFLCRRIGTGEPRVANHSSVYWVPEEEFRATPSSEFVGELKREVLELLDEFKVANDLS